MDWKELEAAGIELRYDEPMRLHTSFRVGGDAEAMALPRDASELKLALLAARERGVPVTVLGNGTNVLVRDGGLDGLTIVLGEAMGAVRFEGMRVVAQGGARLTALARACVEKGFAGLEFAGGIPGSVGGAVAMNAGAYGGEIAQCFEWARCVAMDGGGILFT